MLSAKSLVMEHGAHRALDDVSFEVRPGEIFCLLGANGAGKSTTIKLFLGFLKPTSGAAEVDGLSAQRRPQEVRRRLLYIPETVALYDLMKAGKWQEALALYQWFTPLLHLDVSTKLVQNIKLAETLAGVGNEHVRRPRLPLVGAERERCAGIIEAALAKRPRQYQSK